jgi:hypothetical protein
VGLEVSASLFSEGTREKRHLQYSVLELGT